MEARARAARAALALVALMSALVGLIVILTVLASRADLRTIGPLVLFSVTLAASLASRPPFRERTVPATDVAAAAAVAGWAFLLVPGEAEPGRTTVIVIGTAVVLTALALAYAARTYRLAGDGRRYPTREGWRLLLWIALPAFALPWVSIGLTLGQGLPGVLALTVWLLATLAALLPWARTGIARPRHGWPPVAIAVVLGSVIGSIDPLGLAGDIRVMLLTSGAILLAVALYLRVESPIDTAGDVADEPIAPQAMVRPIVGAWAGTVVLAVVLIAVSITEART